MAAQALDNRQTHRQEKWVEELLIARPPKPRPVGYFRGGIRPYAGCHWKDYAQRKFRKNVHPTQRAMVGPPFLA